MWPRPKLPSRWWRRTRGAARSWCRRWRAPAAVELARGFAALGDPARLRILSLLAAAPSGEICVCEFTEPLGKTQGTVSHHLKVLTETGLVEGDRRGKWVWYRLVPDRLAALGAAIGRP